MDEPIAPAFREFNQLVMDLCDEEDKEVLAPATSTKFPPIPMLRDNRRADRRLRFEAAATQAFIAAIAGGIPRDEAAAQIKRVAESLEKLFAEPWWQMLHVESKTEAEKEAVAKEFRQIWDECHAARQDVFHLALTMAIEAEPIGEPAKPSRFPTVREVIDAICAVTNIVTVHGDFGIRARTGSAAGVDCVERRVWCGARRIWIRWNRG